VELDPQSIEKRDFPTARQGYDPESVDAHLRAISAAVGQLTGHIRGDASLGSAAGTQVQGILQAAEATAADLVREARESAANIRAQAGEDVARGRDDAIAVARTRVAEAEQATSALLASVEAVAGEVGALLETVRSAAGALSSSPTATQTGIPELHDGGATPQLLAQPPAPAPEVAAPAPEVHAPAPEISAPAPEPAAAAPDVHVAAPAPSVSTPDTPSAHAANGDIDSARLVALNMALNGDSREQAERYLAEHFDLADRQRLLDEVYAAIEG